MYQRRKAPSDEKVSLDQDRRRSTISHQDSLVKRLCSRFYKVIVIIGLLALIQMLVGVFLHFDVQNVFSSLQDNSPNELEDLIERFGLQSTCSSIHKDAISAINRAKTINCKQELLEVACKNEAKKLHPNKILNTCPAQKNASTVGNHLGCYRDSFEKRILLGSFTKLMDSNSPEACIQLCSESGFHLAGVQYGNECFCGNEKIDESFLLKDEFCKRPCPGDKAKTCGGYLTMNVYETGIVVSTHSPTAFDTSGNKDPVRITFLLTVSGRAVRQVKRLIKMLYRPNHYILIHVDSREDYMHRELSFLEEKFKNIKLVQNRYDTIWGGASLLQMLLSSFKELVKLNWKWDYVMNLSESDFPIKTVEELVQYLTDNKGQNFVKSHGKDAPSFIRKQGLTRVFHQCDHHMWRLGHRELPRGIQIDGGSDWICLHKSFVQTLIEDKDETIEALKEYFKYALLPAETFFHVSLRNSRFCSSVINNNLHLTNWRRKQGCKCQHRAVVDWCGCSPNNFLTSDFPRINQTVSKDLFFGRKFEPIVNQGIINRVEQWINQEVQSIQYQTTKMLYWQNIFHHADKSPQPNPDLLEAAAVTVGSQIHKLKNVDNQVTLKNVKEITSFHVDDILDGILVLSSVQLDQDDNEVEVFVKPRPLVKTSVISHPSGQQRFLQTSVGVNFDPKEVIFRNMFNLITIQSKIHIIFRLDDGPGINGTVLLFDPKGMTRFSRHMSFNESSFNDAIEADISGPLMPPGIWTLLVLTSPEDVLIRLNFPVFPFLSKQKEQPDLSTKRNATLEKFDPFFKKAERSEHQELLEEVIQDSTRAKDGFSYESLQNLLSLFYEVEDICSTVGHEKIPSCERTLWSSRYPDPKSQISSINEKIGKLV